MQFTGQEEINTIQSWMVVQFLSNLRPTRLVKFHSIHSSICIDIRDSGIPKDLVLNPFIAIKILIWFLYTRYMQMSSPIMFSWIVFLMRDLSPRGPESTRPELIELHRTSCIAWTLMLCMDSFSYCATRVNIRAIRLQGQYWTPDRRRVTQSYLHMKDWDISSEWKKWHTYVLSLVSFFSIQNIHILETGKGAHDANSKESDEKNNLLANRKRSCIA